MALDWTHPQDALQTVLPRVALRWTPDGKGARGRPKETWRRTVDKELKENKLTWGDAGEDSSEQARVAILEGDGRAARV
nr:hypothetical protein BaRGS_005075 [Batillaria attramentaria]